MAPVRITIVTLGHMPPDFTLATVHKWRSKLFTAVGAVESYALTTNADGPDWEFTDDAIGEALPTTFDGEVLFVITNVRLTSNYYARRLTGNRVAVSLHEIADIMRAAHIPIENAILRLLYSVALTYLRFDRKVPATGVNDAFTHDETRGCVFDMNAFKPDLVASCHAPIICADCANRMEHEKVPLTLLQSTRQELGGIRKSLYFRLADWVRRHPILALVFSTLAALAVSICASLIASYLYAALTASPPAVTK